MRTGDPSLVFDGKHGKLGEFVLPGTLGQCVEHHLRRFVCVISCRANGQDDTDGLLHTLEYTRRDFGLVTLRRAVNDPDMGALAPQV